jgi:hypothetical protein
MGSVRYDPVKNAYVYGPGPDDDVAQSADGAIVHSDGVHAITKGSIALLSLTPPTAGEEGIRMTVVSRTPFAHVITYAEGLGGRGGAFVKINFLNIGDSIVLLADNLHWVAVGAPFGATLSA